MRLKPHLGFVMALLMVLLAFAWLVLDSRAEGAVSDPQPAYEMALNPAGSAFEMNRGPQGNLWISDYEAREIWDVDPVGGTYTIYEGIGLPGDARSDGAGTVWYARGPGNYLGQLSIGSGTVTLWEMPGVVGLYGTQLDASGNVWATGFFDPFLFRFNPTSQELCSYPIPSTAPSLYLAPSSQGIWLAEGNGDYIFHLDPALNEVNRWTLPAAGWPFGLDIDPESNLWWTDYSMGTVNRLEAELNRLTTFTPPVASNPVMLDASTNEVWFSDDVNSVVGGLRPDAVEGVISTLTAGTVPVAPTCAVIEPAATTPVTVTTELISFTPTSYPLAMDTEGWTVLTVPDMGAPYGIRATEWSAWMVDYDRRVLTWLLFGSSVTACKLEDADGDLGTPEDQTPVPGWRMYLTVDGVRQEPGELTRSAGCYTWQDLEPGHTYGVEEAVQVGWEALTPQSHDFGVGLAGERYQHTFVNARGATIQVFLPLVLRNQGAASRQPGD